MTIITTHPRQEALVARDCTDKGNKWAADNCLFLFFLTSSFKEKKGGDVWAYV